MLNVGLFSPVTSTTVIKSFEIITGARSFRYVPRAPAVNRDSPSSPRKIAVKELL